MNQLTCQEFIDFIDGYLDGELDPAQQSALAEHLSMCDECQGYLKTYQESIGVFRTICADDALPSDVPASLVKGILAALDRKT